MLDILANGPGFDGIWSSSMSDTIVEAFQESGQPFKPIVGADSNAFAQQLVDVEGLTGALVTNPASVGGAGVTLALRVLTREPVEPATRIMPVLMENVTEAGKAALAAAADPSVPATWPIGISMPGWTTYTRDQVLPGTGCDGPGEQAEPSA